MEHQYVNAEATSIESGLSYSGRSVCIPSKARESAREETAFKAGKAMKAWCRQKSAEVVVLRDTSPGKPGRSHKDGKDRMLEWPSNQEVYGNSDNNRNTLANYL